MILVTGATGSVGSATLDSLKQVSQPHTDSFLRPSLIGDDFLLPPLILTSSLLLRVWPCGRDSWHPPTAQCALRFVRTTRRTRSRSTTHRSQTHITPHTSTSTLYRSAHSTSVARLLCRGWLVQAEFALIDYDDIESVFSALQGVTTLFIVTPYTYKQNVIARLLVDAAKAAGTQYIVHLGVSQPAKSAGDYICWHLFTEKYIEASGLGWVALRPNMFIDNLQQYGGIHTFKSGTLSFPLKPDLRLPWVTTEDIGAVSANVLVNPAQYVSQVIPITSELNNIHGIVEAIEKVRGGKHVTVETLSSTAFYRQIVDAGGDPAYFDGFKVNVDEHNALDDATKAWGAKEGLDAVRRVAKKEPMSSSEWAQKYKETWTQ